VFILGALIITAVVVGVITYRPAAIGQERATPNWEGAVVPGLIFFVGNALVVGVGPAVAGVAGLTLMVVGVVLLVRNRRRASV